MLLTAPWWPLLPNSEADSSVVGLTLVSFYPVCEQAGFTSIIRGGGECFLSEDASAIQSDIPRDGQILSILVSFL